MIVMNPQRVRFGSVSLSNVVWVAIDRVGTRAVREWSDEGPFPTFVDVPEQVVTITLVQELVGEDLATPFAGGSFGLGLGVGSLASLDFVTSPNATDQARRRVTVLSVLVGLEHSVSRRRATRTFTFEAVALGTGAGAGSVDPVVVIDAGGL